MIIRDVLDNQVIDKKGNKIGKVDGVIAITREGKPPRIAYIEIGATTMARRMHPKLEQWMEFWLSRLGPRNVKPYRVPFSKVTEIGVDVVVDVDTEQEEVSAMAWENWLRDNVISKIPISGGS